MQIVYKGLQSSFMSLAWPWSGSSLPHGELVGVLRPGLGPDVVRPQFLHHQLCDQPKPKVWQVDIFAHGWLAGQLQLAGWLADWLSHKMSPDPSLQAEISGGQVCHYFGQVDHQSDVSPSQRHLMAKCDTTSGQVDLLIWG